MLFLFICEKNFFLKDMNFVCFLLRVNIDKGKRYCGYVVLLIRIWISM